jgi:hypothetical protein
VQITVQVPATDKELIAELAALPGADVGKEERFDGAELVRIAFDMAAMAGALSATAGGLLSAAKKTASIVETFRKTFRKGARRYRNDPNGDFIVTADNQVIVTSSMSDDEVEKQIDRLERKTSKSRTQKRTDRKANKPTRAKKKK